MPTDEAEQISSLVRAGLWSLWAAASIHRSEQRARPNDTHTSVAAAAVSEADELLVAFNARFPLEEMLT